MPSLTTLTEELCVAIIEHLDVDSFIQLSQTNQLFQRLCHVDVPGRHEEAEIFLSMSHASFFIVFKRSRCAAVTLSVRTNEASSN